jgi:mRNA interferase YafQ
MPKLRLFLSTRFKKDFKKFRNNQKVRDLVEQISVLLQNQIALDVKYRDHNLAGNWTGYRECHILPDCLLIYKMSHDELHFVRIGSHAELFG